MIRGIVLRFDVVIRNAIRVDFGFHREVDIERVIYCDSSYWFRQIELNTC